MRNVLTLIADPVRVELDSGIVDTARSALERAGARVAGRLTGRVKEPILGRDGKLRVLQEVAAERRVARAQILAVGDGANDLPMLKAAGLGVAYRAKPAAAAAKARIEHGDLTVFLTVLLYIQGYRAEEIAE